MRVSDTAPAPADERDQAASPIVLIVEDDPDVSNLIAEMLEDVACRLLSVTTGEAALALLERHAVNLAIVDQALPGMSGPAFVVSARANVPGLRAIYVSGAPVEAVGPCDAVLPKPFRAAELQTTVTRLLAFRQAD